MPFTPRAKRALELAFAESRQFPIAVGGNYICSGHLLLGIIGDEQTVASQVLADLGVDLPMFRERVLTRIRETGTTTSSTLNLFRRAANKHSESMVKVMDTAQIEARRLGHNFVGT